MLTTTLTVLLWLLTPGAPVTEVDLRFVAVQRALSGARPPSQAEALAELLLQDAGVRLLSLPAPNTAARRAARVRATQLITAWAKRRNG